MTQNFISFVAIAALINYCFAWFGGCFHDAVGSWRLLRSRNRSGAGRGRGLG